MRNIFDQFDGRENRLTHALVSALWRDRALCRDFLRSFVPDFSYDTSSLRLEEQTIPGEPQPRLPEERRGLPDAVFWDQGNEVLAIEAKVTAPIALDQLRRHQRTLRRAGFRRVHGMAIVVRPSSIRDPSWCVIDWIEVYRWLGPWRGHSAWAEELARYIEIVETQMADEEIDAGARLTDFSGIHFSDERPYSYHAAKLALRGLMDAVAADARALKEMGLAGRLIHRAAITDQGRVWDYLAWRQKGNTHTGHVHFTASIGPDSATAYITVPNGAGRVWRVLRQTDVDGFRAAVDRFLASVAPVARVTGVTPELHLVQRRFASQRASGIHDGRLVIDPRTAFRGRGKSLRPRLKYQPQWLELLYTLIQSKRANFQMQIGCRFDYEKCRRLASSEAKSLFVDTWVAGKAFLDHCGIPVRPF